MNEEEEVEVYVLYVFRFPSVGGPAVSQRVPVTATALSRLHCIPSSLWDGNESFLTAPRPVTQRGGWRRVEGEEAALRHRQPPNCPFCVVIMTSLPAAVGRWPGVGGVFCVLTAGMFSLLLRSSQRPECFLCVDWVGQLSRS